MKRGFWGMNYINMAAAIMFAGIGLYLGRPVIVVISLAILGLGLWTKRGFARLAARDRVLWRRFIKEHPNLKKEKYITWHYGKNEKDCNKWAEKVMKGEITGVSYFAPAFPYESNPEPKSGEYSMLLDWSNNPVCILQTISVERIPYQDVTLEHVGIEGFGDIESWRSTQLPEYMSICKELQMDFDEGMPILFEHFKVVYEAEQE